MEHRIETESLNIDRLTDGVKRPNRLVVVAGGVAVRGTEERRLTAPPTYPNDREWAQTNLLS